MSYIPNAVAPDDRKLRDLIEAAQRQPGLADIMRAHAIVQQAAQVVSEVQSTSMPQVHSFGVLSSTFVR